MHRQWVFLPDPHTRVKLLLPPAIKVDYRAACFCHRELIDIGYVCSVCLSSMYLHAQMNQNELRFTFYCFVFFLQFSVNLVRFAPHASEYSMDLLQWMLKMINSFACFFSVPYSKCRHRFPAKPKRRKPRAEDFRRDTWAIENAFCTEFILEFSCSLFNKFNFHFLSTSFLWDLFWKKIVKVALRLPEYKKKKKTIDFVRVNCLWFWCTEIFSASFQYRISLEWILGELQHITVEEKMMEKNI